MSELIKDAEIFATGMWPGQGAAGITFTEADLDGVVMAFNTLGLRGRVPLKMGHDGADARTDDSAPALGWIEAVRREGTKLLADIRLTSDKLAGMIRAGAYKFVSVEMLRNVQAHTRLIPWVLDAVALLGATTPAVGILKDLQASMQMSRRAGVRLRGERLAFKRESVNTHGDDKDMDEAQVQALVDKAVKKATDDTSTKFTAEVATLKTKLDASEADTAKARAEAHRVTLMAPIEAAIRDGVINAAAKDKFVQMNAVADDAKVLLTKPAAAEEFVKDVKDMERYKGPGGTRRKASASGDDDVAKLATMTCANVVTFKVEKDVVARGGKLSCFADLETSNQRVLAQDKDLALQYFTNPSALYEPPTGDSTAA